MEVPSMLTTSSMASDSKAKEEHYPAFLHVTLKMVNIEGNWQYTMRKLLRSVEKVINCQIMDDGTANVSGYIDQDQFLESWEKYRKKIKLVHWQFGECERNLVKKTKAPSTITANPSGNNVNGAGGYYLPQGPQSYYGYASYNGHGAYYDVGSYGNGGYYNGFYGNGGSIGYGYTYYQPVVYQKNTGHNHIECAGHASECSGQHIEKPMNANKTPDTTPSNKPHEKSSKSIFQNLAGFGKDLTSRVIPKRGSKV
ncbi:hypothetical protein Tco_1125619 [Tanacetum coccineum]|uniref:Uncharacterized protein n=1 Tax=Tanacetum coccineum TaxID=301880 RepID=A0ABQ5J9I0_9ASTR